MFRRLVVLFAAGLCLVATATSIRAGASPRDGSTASPRGGTGGSTLQQYAAATWRSFVAMADTASGLPTDQLFADGHTDVQTSTTNIGAYLWSAVAAQRLGIISRAELVRRTLVTIGTLETMATAPTSWPEDRARTG